MHRASSTTPSRPIVMSGEPRLAQPRHLATATAMIESTVMRVKKAEMIRVLHAEPTFAEVFTAHLLTRNSRVEEDLVDQLFNSSEKRLARTLNLWDPAVRGQIRSFPCRSIGISLAVVAVCRVPRWAGKSGREPRANASTAGILFLFSRARISSVFRALRLRHRDWDFWRD